MPWELNKTAPFENDVWELYNLKTDLSETTDLAEKQPDRRDSLLQELEAWRVSVRAERMLPNPDCDPKAKPRNKKAGKSADEPR